MTRAIGLRATCAALVGVIAGVHFQQYVEFMSHVPTIGVLFLLNAAGGAGLALALLAGDQHLRAHAAVGAIGLSLGSLVSIVIALESSLFGYSEPSLRLPVVIAIATEAVALVPLALLARSDGRTMLRHGGVAPAARPTE